MRAKSSLKPSLLIGVALLAGCTSAPSTNEPPNLQPHKEEIRRYMEGGGYERDVAAVARQAQAWLEARVQQGGARLTVVFDLDETLWSNWPLIKRQDFGYVPAEWQRWVGEARAPALAPVRDLLHAAQRLGFEVVLLTGRAERDRIATERNLRAIGCAGYAQLVCQPDGDRRPNAAFKTAARQELARVGRTIVANIGDQASDLAGGFAERTFKLPNPLYLTE